MPGLTEIERVRLVADEIDGALELLGQVGATASTAITDGKRLGSLMDQCISLCEEAGNVVREPIRTIHHFACTGGTLISKCLSAMPNVQLLSEVNPFNPHVENAGSPRFAPSDFSRLMLQSTRGSRAETIQELFLSSLRVVYEDSNRRGLRLVLRDHTHTSYCVGRSISKLPNLRDAVRTGFDVRSVVTVRHPAQSYYSLHHLGWSKSFHPSTYDEYCRRYLVFLEDHRGVPVIRYEDFTRSPLEVMASMCELLDLSYSDQFPYLFSVFKLTGDSGRLSDVIEHREDRPITDELAAEAAASPHHRKLMDLLGYD